MLARQQVSIDAAAIADADFDSLIESAVHGEFPIEAACFPSDARAMTMIDIDGGGDPMLLNLAAAFGNPAPVALAPTSVGKSGSISSTFPTAKHGCRLMLHSKPPAKPLGQHERAAMNGFGFVQIVRPSRTIYS
ncbi:MAG: hypothetical protein IPP23_15100 [Sphingomonadales bacterium]|nr:hypothetical protein [Sphingomonadales bacterium]